MEDKNIDFIINGELYLKRGPETYSSSNKVRELDDEISDIEFDMSKENPDFSKADKLAGYQKLRNMAKSLEGKTDYSGTTDFWQLSTSDGRNINLQRCETEYNINKTYQSIQVMNKDFIKLSEFLKKAIFVGREFRRTKPVQHSSGYINKSFMESGLIKTRYIVLYATQDLFLIRRIDKYTGDKYTLINSLYTLDGNYEFFGPVYREYKDINKVYYEILEQVTSNHKGRRKS